MRIKEPHLRQTCFILSQLWCFCFAMEIHKEPDCSVALGPLDSWLRSRFNLLLLELTELKMKKVHGK